MVKDVHVVTRLVRQITINTGRPWLEFRRNYECAVPHFDRLEHGKKGHPSSNGDGFALGPTALLKVRTNRFSREKDDHYVCTHRV
jgi:hypothetical protein